MNQTLTSYEEPMRFCFELAEEGRGKVGTGARVAAVLLRQQQIIATGVHRMFGSIHAERDLLQSFPNPVEPDDVLVVNLEPCCPSPTKKTPPCTEIILQRGIRNIVYGLQDPDTRVAGRGIEILREAGISVQGPVLPEECARYNRGFVSMRTNNRPWITIKETSTQHDIFCDDDAVALRKTGEEPAQHFFLRNEHDAVLIDAKTANDHSLTLHTAKKHPYNFQPLRVILDPTSEYRLQSMTPRELARTIIITDASTTQNHLEEFRSQGGRVLQVGTENTRFHMRDILQVLTTPTKEYNGLTSILVEGDSEHVAPFKELTLADEKFSALL